MARIYTISFDNVSVAAAQDLFQIKGATGKLVRVLRFYLACVDTTAPTNQQLRLRSRYLPATVTDGSGGSVPTVTKRDPGDSAATFTALANNATTVATSTGTPLVVGEWGFNVFSVFDETIDFPVPVIVNTSITLELLSTVSGTVHLSGFAQVSEAG